MFLDSGNDPALLFHGSFGFREVGQHVMAGTDLRAAMLVKELCSYPWVRDTYGDAPARPALAAAARAAGAQSPRTLATGT